MLAIRRGQANSHGLYCVNALDLACLPLGLATIPPVAIRIISQSHKARRTSGFVLLVGLFTEFFWSVNSSQKTAAVIIIIIYPNEQTVN